MFKLLLLCFTSSLTSQVISVAFYIEREKSDIFCLEVLISAWGYFTCRKYTTRDQRLYFPSEGSHTQDIYALKKIHQPQPGVNPRTSDPMARMITTAPPGSITTFNWPQSVYTTGHMQPMLCVDSPHVSVEPWVPWVIKLLTRIYGDQADLTSSSAGIAMPLPSIDRRRHRETEIMWRQKARRIQTYSCVLWERWLKLPRCFCRKSSEIDA